MREIKGNKGITLISIIITVIIMIIIAGVGIWALINDGLIGQASLVTRQNVAIEHKEKLELAALEMRLRAVATSENYTLERVMEECKNVVFKDNPDVVVYVNEAEIIDFKNNIILKIRMLAGGGIYVYQEFPDDVNDREYITKFELEEVDMGELVTGIKVTANSNKGINKIILTNTLEERLINSNGNEEVEETFEVTLNGIYEVKIIGKTGVVKTEIINIRTFVGVPIITATPTTLTNQDVEVEVTYDTYAVGYERVYSLDNGNTWIDSTETSVKFTLTENITIKAGYRKGEDLKFVNTLGILNIDKIAPTDFSLNAYADKRTIVVSGSTVDEGSEGVSESNIGIARYEVQLLNDDNSVNIDWLSIGTSTSYTFEGLTEDTTYKVNMRAIDKAGNITQSENSDVVVEIVGIIANGTWTGTENSPKLGSGMTPVAWDDAGEEFVPTITEEWYDYSKNKWANAKTDEDDSYWVWIPRFEYKISNLSTNPPISINFIPTSHVKESNGYIVHPAFIDDSENNFVNGGWDSELAGIWVMKFEASNNGGNPASKPGQTAWGSLSIGTMFANSKSYDELKLKNSLLETHMIKNSEWGAVTYLTQSKYGRGQTQVTINNSSSYKTGYAGGSVSAAQNVGTTAWNTAKGVLASTTGNITGVYDMSGGVWEYVAAGWSSYTYGFDNRISSKYNTVYTSYNKVGDATSETRDWFGDYAFNISAARPYFKRGGGFNMGEDSGIFAYDSYDGKGYPYYSFRVVMSVP